jgi:hypothetical protein
MMRLARATTAAGLTLALAAGSLAGQEPLEVRIRSGEEGWGPVVHLAPLLEHPPIADALAAGLPLRVRVRVELWRSGFFDRQRAWAEATVAVLRDPLDGSFQVELPGHVARYPRQADAERAVARAMEFSMSPAGPGRYYYLARLEAETLSLSDLGELRRWLRGEARPALEGRVPVEQAVERGARRIALRILGLPALRHEARSPSFAVQ